MVESLLPAFARTLVFLESNRDLIASNHTAGAVAALYNLYLLTNGSRYLHAAKKNAADLLDAQDEEGWYPEYGDFTPATRA